MSVDVRDSHRFAQLRRNHSRGSKARTQRPRSESVQINMAGVMGRGSGAGLRIRDVYTVRDPIRRHQDASFCAAAAAACLAERRFDAPGVSSPPIRWAAKCLGLRLRRTPQRLGRRPSILPVARDVHPSLQR